MTSSFNRNGDIDCLYILRSMGVRGLRFFQTAHDMRIISLKKHLENNKSRSVIMEKVYENETKKCIRVGNKFFKNLTLHLNKMNYHAHLFKSTSLNARKNICKHTRKRK